MCSFHFVIYLKDKCPRTEILIKLIAFTAVLRTFLNEIAFCFVLFLTMNTWGWKKVVQFGATPLICEGTSRFVYLCFYTSVRKVSNVLDDYGIILTSESP